MPVRNTSPRPRRHRIAVGACLMAMVGSGHAATFGNEDANIEFFGNLYPQYQWTSFGQHTAVGSQVSTLTTKSNTSTTLRSVTDKPDADRVNWSQSFFAMRGHYRFNPDWDVGFRLDEQVTEPYDNSEYFNRSRDAYVYVAHRVLGTFTGGRINSILSNWGDPVRMLGVSESNFVSTSALLGGAAFGTGSRAGTTTWVTRASHGYKWESAKWNGFSLGTSYMPHRDGPDYGRPRRAYSYGIRWEQGPWYAALQYERHTNHLVISGVPTTTPAATSITNQGGGSQDRNLRLSAAYQAKRVKLGVDLSRVQYAEDPTAAYGKFKSYTVPTWKVSAEWQATPKLTLAANYIHAGAGHCVLSGAAPCSSYGLGAQAYNVGVQYSLFKYTSLVALAGRIDNGVSSSYGSPVRAPVGATVDNLALGLHVKY
ncbi:porin [Pseudoxanthomonas winnipegensis]|uniref:Porin n=1 Tax=Pseudoxanthomonas winnipegensis TaxID=2480810 RepID=A0A4V2HEI1_9GAMM|nr:porin [Pseudoxanthomonas winnipegensis]RZZ89761.1 porin [Pseudoxanthomonas winnipegensis]TAA32812.1 porin [Pseudoxanthomonas winnipegensis]TAA43056.1 porin [Pseudoxanthomonas winnipegensis]TBV78705.1 porin [Pseudoxanthomonas winnipegensis]